MSDLARACRALLATVDLEHLWTDDGPVPEATVLLDDDSLSPRARLALLAAWTFWNGSGATTLAEHLAHVSDDPLVALSLLLGGTQMKSLYTAIVVARGGGREGRVTGTEPALDLRMSPPRVLGGDGSATNPEQLFAAGYAACFESSLRRAAQLEKRALGDVEIAAHVSLVLEDDGTLQIAVALHATIAGLARADTLALMEAAHRICPYSNATRGNVTVDLVAA